MVDVLRRENDMEDRINMSTEQFDENKESVYSVCSTGGGYGWGTILYDSETGKWYEHMYHCGSVDISEDYDDGIREVYEKKYVLDQLIKKNNLHGLIKYYQVLDAETNLCEVIENLQKSHGGYLRAARYLESPYHIYYRFANGDYCVWSSDVFYSHNNDGECTVDYYVINRILKEKDTVRVCKYHFGDKKWKEMDLEGEICSVLDPIEYSEIIEKKNKRSLGALKVDSSEADVDTKTPPKNRSFIAKLFGK